MKSTKLSKSIMLLAIGGMLVVGQASIALAQVVGQGRGTPGDGGGDVLHREICGTVGGQIECGSDRPPRPKLIGDNCCWTRTQKKRIRIGRHWRVIHVPRGRSCVKVTGMQECMKRVRRGR